MRPDEFYWEEDRRKWRTLITYTDTSGSVRRKAIRANSKNDLRLKAAQFRAKVITGMRIAHNERIGLERAIDTWLENIEQKELSPNTLRHYRLQARHIKQLFKAKSLKSISIQEVENALQRHYKGGHSPQSVRHIKTVLHTFLRFCQKSGWVIENSAVLADMPVKVIRKNENYWSANQAHQFLETAKDDRYYLAYLLALTTGLRLGELLALRWSDVRSENRLLMVDETLVSGSTHLFKPPKNNRIRLVPITEALLVQIEAHRQRQLAEMVKNNWINPLELMFTTKRGQPKDGSTLTHEFQALRVKAKIKPITFHGLRHTWSTLANQLGISAVDRMTQLGHSDTRLTDMVYTAVPTEQLREAAKKMEQLIGY